VAAHAVGVEEADPEDEVVDWRRRAGYEPDGKRFTRVEKKSRLTLSIDRLATRDLHLSRAPPALAREEHVLNAIRTGPSCAGLGRYHRRGFAAGRQRRSGCRRRGRCPRPRGSAP